MDKIQRIEDIRVVVETIGDAGMEKELEISPESAALSLGDKDIVVNGPFGIQYVVTRDRETGKVDIEVSLRGELQTSCSRCLKPLMYRVDLKLQTVYLPAAPDMSDNLEAERQSPEIGYYRREILLGEYIRSELVLSLPQIYLCSPDCKGLCPQCGADLNIDKCTCIKDIDPRLQKLKEIKTRLGGNTK